MLTTPCARVITTGAAHLMPAVLGALFVRGTPLVLSRNLTISSQAAGNPVHLPHNCTAAATNRAAAAAAAPGGLLALVHSTRRQQQPVPAQLGQSYGSPVIGLAEEMAMEVGGSAGITSEQLSGG